LPGIAKTPATTGVELMLVVVQAVVVVLSGMLIALVVA
jgi:hypothetical protein